MAQVFLVNKNGTKTELGVVKSLEFKPKQIHSGDEIEQMLEDWTERDFLERNQISFEAELTKEGAEMLEEVIYSIPLAE